MIASLPFDDPRHLLVHRWLVEECALLDAHRLDEWLELLADDVRYVMPVPVTAPLGPNAEPASTMDHFDEDRFSLRKRVARFATDHAWTENPPSRVRRHLTNVRTFATDD